jgi:SAM-dependent methyltransferase
LLEFTGERIVPGQIDPDLWNEHFSRYAFAKRLARHKRVLDIGCGEGYGSCVLAQAAVSVTAVDISREAIEAARAKYVAPNLAYEQSSGTCIELPPSSFDLIVCFEVIEHLEDWPALLSEAKRLLAPGGQLVISTPNRLYYAESRKLSGPNPYHVHEFDFAEFQQALSEHFSSVVLFTQNHSGSIVFQPTAKGPQHAAEVLIEHRESAPEDSHFFLAVCAQSAQTGSPTYVFVPAASNVLREREKHIEKLEGELRQKDEWLEALKKEHSGLVELYRSQSTDLASVQAWVKQLDRKILDLESELVKVHETAQNRILGMEEDIRQRAAHIEKLDAEVKSANAELTKSVALLDAAEATVVERTKWAQSLQEQLERLMGEIGASRWLKIGRALGIGPDLKS